MENHLLPNNFCMNLLMIWGMQQDFLAI